MYFKKIKLKNYRNFSDLSIEFDPNLNIFIGNNAQGKTNLLEGINFIVKGSSYRTKEDKEVINWNNKSAYLFGEVNKDDENIQVALALEKKSENFYKNKLIKIIKINQNIQKKKREQLIIWDPRLIERGSFLILTRIKFIKKINCLAHKFHQKITKEKENIILTYQSNILKNQEESISSINKKFKDKLEEYIEKEIEQRATLLGPHRDDFSVYINGFNVASYGSQGQQRTAILSLKLSELELIKEKEGVYPIFFLDDVMSELDEDRRHFLLGLIIDKKVQTFITSINLDYFNSGIKVKSRIFKIEEGKVINL